MASVERDDLTIGSGNAGEFTARTRDSRRRTVIVERGLLGGACPNVACLPSENLIWSAKVISLARRGMEFASRLIPCASTWRQSSAVSARWSGSCARYTRIIPKPAARN